MPDDFPPRRSPPRGSTPLPRPPSQPEGLAPYEIWTEFLREWLEDRREGITLRAIHNVVARMNDEFSDFKQRVALLEGIQEQRGNLERSPTGSYVIPQGGFPPPPAPAKPTPSSHSLIGGIMKDAASKLVAAVVPIVLGVILGALAQRGCAVVPVSQAAAPSPSVPGRAP